jgi:hypothetical protein
MLIAKDHGKDAAVAHDAEPENEPELVGAEA